MNKRNRNRFRVFVLLFTPLLLLLALILDRWWAWLSLIAFWMWIIKKYMDEDPKG